ncbi:hypothetical protein VNI00_001024 [Paramarasmius palmivorus]|uniref:Uncharacterized protein n=1 Tax=Paramarasmius palmivorus TaxID=297713 RepID=A0AAW0E8B7_9AGAR
MYRSPSPYGPPPETQFSTPYAPAAPQSPSPGQIQPGQITYTTSTGPDGKMIYHPFKAVPASYQTPSGIVSGIQWVPAEATQILPAGAQPASTDFAEAWNRGNLTREDKAALKEWQRAEDKRRRKEEKESAKMLRDKERLNQARYDDQDLYHARQQDAVTRERRKSFNAGVAFPGAAGGYAPSSPYQGAYPQPPHSPGPTGYARERKYSSGGGLLSDLDRQFNDLGVNDERIAGPGMARPRKYSTHESAAAAERARRMSGNFGPERPLSAYGGAAGSHSPNTGSAYPPRPYSRNAGAYPATSQYANPSPNLRSAEPAYVPPHAPRPSSPYGSANYPPSPNYAADPYARAASPFAPGGTVPDVYPPGHIMEGQPIARSRATTPLPGTVPVPPVGGYASSAGGVGGVGVAFPQSGAYPPQHIPGSPQPGALGGHAASAAGQLAAPECFSRPMNAAHPYTPFDPMKIQDMEDFYDHIPRMPAVLQAHDMFNEDWSRLMEDVALAWSGRLPVPAPASNRPPKRTTVTATLVDLWNGSFFNRRGAELVLYKGRERRSGSQAGTIDMHLPVRDDYDDDSSSEETTDSDDDDDPRYNAAYGMYGGRPGYGPTPDVMEMRQKRIAAKAERRRRRKEKKSRRRAREREKKWTLWLICVPQGGVPGQPGSAYQAPHHGGHAGVGVPGSGATGYGAVPASPYGSGAYGAAAGGVYGTGGYGGGI